MSSVSGLFSVVLSVLSRLHACGHLTFPCTYSPTHPSAHSLGTRPYLTSSHQTHRTVYLCILIHLPSSLTYLIHTRLISFHPSYNNITHCIVYPSSSSSSSSHIFVYAIPKSVAMENFFFCFLFFVSFLFVSSRLVFARVSFSLHSYACLLLNFVRSIRKECGPCVDLFFVYTVIYCTYDTDRLIVDWGCRLIE